MTSTLVCLPPAGTHQFFVTAPTLSCAVCCADEGGEGRRACTMRSLTKHPSQTALTHSPWVPQLDRITSPSANSGSRVTHTEHLP